VRERHESWMEFTDHPDSSITARFGVAGLEWATGWVLSYGLAAKVLEPPELVERVRRAAEEVRRMYAEAPT